MKIRKNISSHSCFNCDNALPIGEGDHICNNYANENMPSVIVINEYAPTDDFIKCGGKRWKEY